MLTKQLQLVLQLPGNKHLTTEFHPICPTLTPSHHSLALSAAMPF